MANTLYADLIDEVLPHLAADPSDPVTELAIKRAAIEFCNDSWVWRFIPDVQDLSSGVNEYDLEPPAGADVSAIIDVQLDNVPLKPRTVAWLNEHIPGWKTVPAAVKYYTQVDTAQIILAPLPDYNQSAAISMSAALQPSQLSTGFPKWIATQYLYQIADGAIARLMLMAGKPWSDPQNGAIHMMAFQNAIANAKADALSALGTAPLRVTAQH